MSGQSVSTDTQKRNLKEGASKKSAPTTVTVRGEVEVVRSELEDLTDRLRTLEGSEDKLTEFVAANWQKVVGGVVVLLLVVWLVGAVREANNKKLEGAALEFSQAQSMYESVFFPAEGVTLTAEELQKKQSALIENVKVLTEEDVSGSYALFSGLYSAAYRLRTGELDKAREELAKYNLARFSGVSSVAKRSSLNAKSLSDEFAALLNVRLLLSAKDAPQIPEIRKQLKEIALGAQLVNAEAVMILARLSDSDGEKTEVREISLALGAARPELTEELTRGLGKYGIGS